MVDAPAFRYGCRVLNNRLGTSVTLDGRSSFLTRPGAKGYAVYGPYEQLPPGRYLVEFVIERADDADFRRDAKCAVLDVATDVGRRRLAKKSVYLSQLAEGRTSFVVAFELDAPTIVEYRVYVTGQAPLRIDAYRRLMPAPDGLADPASLIAAGAFPEEEGQAIPFFRDNVAQLRTLYEQDVAVGVVDGSVVLRVGGIALYARSLDDLNFIGEVFHENAYNVVTDRPLCAIDIGMNIGLTSLMLAAKPEVREVHSFEPFRNTFDRAMDNLRLNPELAARIVPANFGLSDRDWEGSLLVEGADNSGARSTVGVNQGSPAHIELRDAGATLRPIIESARERGLDVIVKVDCEGSEFAVFQSIEAAGLMGDVTAFMVEWHAMFPGRTQQELLAPLRRAGFLVFDRSPPKGNGFFYAARIA